MENEPRWAIEDLFSGEDVLKFGLSFAPNHNKGEVYEVRFERALEELEQEGEIEGFRKTLQHSEDDNNGVDYWVTKDQQDFAFQISSSSRGGRKKKGRRGSVRNRYLAEHGISNVYIRRGRKKELKRIPDLKVNIMSAIGTTL